MTAAALATRFQAIRSGGRAASGDRTTIADAGLPAPLSVDIDRVLALHRRFGGRGTTPLTIDRGNGAAFVDERGLALVRTVGPYLVALSDPITASGEHRAAFLNRLIAFGRTLNRRVLFHALSPYWLPPLHDRGYRFLKIGEAATILLDAASDQQHRSDTCAAAALTAARAGYSFDLICGREASQGRFGRPVGGHANGKTEADTGSCVHTVTATRSPVAVVRTTAGEIVASAAVLRSPDGAELSIDGLWHRDSSAPLDFLIGTLISIATAEGRRTFNLGLAPLAGVGEYRQAHFRERLARFLFEHGDSWFHVKTVRKEMQKFEPVWSPRYLAYPNWLECLPAAAAVAPLLNGSWM